MVSLWTIIQADVFDAAKKDEMSNLNNVYILRFSPCNNYFDFWMDHPPKEIKNTTSQLFYELRTEDYLHQ